MKECLCITRRESIKALLKLTGCAVFAGVAPLPAPSPARGGSGTGSFIVEGTAQAEAFDLKTLIRKTFEAGGGIGKFVSRGDVVVIKPNISWARAPHLAATTHPEVLQGVVELCLEAGAKKVRIADNTIHDARRCFALSGAGRVAKETGAELVFPRSSMMRQMKLGGDRLDVWPVFVPLVEADRLINLPIAKHHALSTLTVGMKNWIGAVGGRRSALHQDIHRSVVDLARFFRPTVVLVDAVRILQRNGPSGGSPSDVAVKNTLILSDDQVAADAKAAALFGRDPSDIGFIRLAREAGLGTIDFQALRQEKVVL